MKTLLDLIREPILIGSIVIAVLMVVGAYLGSHYYYGETVVVEIPEPLAYTPSQHYTPPALDFSELPEPIETKQTQLESEIIPSEELSIEDFLAELTEAEKQTLASEVTPPRESLYGLGPYPEIPHDYHRPNVWDDLEQLHHDGYGSIGHELIHRVLIKLWNQGTKVTSATHNRESGKVYPLYDDTVYVKWKTVEYEDGTVDRYLSRYLCQPSLADYHDSVENGTQPSWLKVVSREDGGIDPYSFLDLY
jgi:hypothetical protein